jgi:Mrp family chromosome partitioning ATPase
MTRIDEAQKRAVAVSVPEAKASNASIQLDALLEMNWPQPFSADLADKLVVMRGTNPDAVSQYRRLADALQELGRQRYVKSILLTSADVREGRTLTAANLALTLSEAYGQRVLLIDLDVRPPRIHPVFNVTGTPGLHEYLTSPSPPPNWPGIQLTSKLTFLPAGTPGSDAFGPLVSTGMRRLMVRAAAKFDWILLDAAPVSLVPDPGQLGAIADATVLVVDAQTTSDERIRETADRLGRNRIAGLVLNRANVARLAID